MFTAESLKSPRTDATLRAQQCMGQYTLVGYLVHGHPLYVKVETVGRAYPHEIFFLYRSSSNTEARWLVTSDKLWIRQNMGVISSCQVFDSWAIPTELPSSSHNIFNIFGLTKKRGPLTWRYIETDDVCNDDFCSLISPTMRRYMRWTEDKSIVLQSTSSTPVTEDLETTVIVSVTVLTKKRTL